MNARHQTPNRLMALLTFLLVLMGLAGVARADDDRAEQHAPLVALLTPGDGAALNTPTLRVQALIAAFKPHAHKSFVFNGHAVAGRNTGRVGHVEIAIDGLVVDRVEHPGCRRQMVADVRIDISGLADGLHTLTVTAFQGDPRHGHGRSVTATFSLDRSLPVAERNRIEEAATPAPFACLALRTDDFDDDDNDAGRRRPHLELEGRIVPSDASDGLDPARDRIVIAVGSRVTVFEAGDLTCKRAKCRFEDRRHPIVQRLELERHGDGSWEIQLRGDRLPSDSSTVYLRIGNDWGGIDLATGERLVRLRSALDTLHQTQATIGPVGGTVETMDAAGVRIRLEIPPGALTRPTVITVTPLLASPLPDSSASLHPGLKLEPEGLVFATPASLTLDFSATGQVITPDHFIFLLTSPLTTLPLSGDVNPATKTLTALLPHFSQTQGGQGNQAYLDLRAWADSVLSTTGNLTLSEIATLLEFSALQQSVGCTTNCVDLGAVAARAGASIAALVGGICPVGGAPTASDAALAQLLQLETIAQQLGTNVPTIRPCMEAVLGALIDQAGTTAASSTDPTLSRLADLAARAQALGFSQLETRALQKLAQALRDLEARLLAQVDAARGTTNETAVTDAAKSELQNELQFASGNGRLLQTDPNLLADIQAAIDSLSGSLSLTVQPFGEAFHQGCGSNSRTSLPPTLTITCSGELTSLTFSVITGANNTLIVNATGSAAERGFVRAKISGRFTVNRPGRVTYDLNPNWGTRGTGVRRDPRVDTSISGPVVVALDISGTVEFPPTGPVTVALVSSGGTVFFATIPIPLAGSAFFVPGVYDFSFFVLFDGPDQGACAVGELVVTCPAARVNGRIMTLTFMP